LPPLDKSVKLEVIVPPGSTAEILLGVSGSLTVGSGTYPFPFVVESPDDRGNICPNDRISENKN